jgi:hypothetical protein
MPTVPTPFLSLPHRQTQPPPHDIAIKTPIDGTEWLIVV